MMRASQWRVRPQLVLAFGTTFALGCPEDDNGGTETSAADESGAGMSAGESGNGETQASATGASCQSTHAACIPDFPKCGPEEFCLMNEDGTTTCQCLACTVASGARCTEQMPCENPEEVCYGLDGETFGECSCVIE